MHSVDPGGVRGPAPARPARRRAGRDARVDRRRPRRRSAACSPSWTAARSGALILDRVDDVVFLRRFGVVPDEQHHGVAHTLVDRGLRRVPRTCDEVRVLARVELPATIGFWRAAGFVEARRDARRTSSCGARSPRRTTSPTPTRCAPSARELARSAAAPVTWWCSPGELGAGKTTFTQGLGAGLGVRGDGHLADLRDRPRAPVPRRRARPGARRRLPARRSRRARRPRPRHRRSRTSVTVVEWGEGLVEGLAESRLEVRITRDGGCHGAGGRRAGSASGPGSWVRAPLAALRARSPALVRDFVGFLGTSGDREGHWVRVSPPRRGNRQPTPASLGACCSPSTPPPRW